MQQRCNTAYTNMKPYVYPYLCFAMQKRQSEAIVYILLLNKFQCITTKSMPVNRFLKILTVKKAKHNKQLHIHKSEKDDT